MGSFPPSALPLLLVGLLVASPASPPDAGEVCLIAPRADPADARGRATAIVPIPRPTVFAVGTLESVRIEREGRPAWQRSGSAGEPLQGPIAWPLAPIRPGERLVLRLRPAHARPGDFAVIELVGAEAPVLERNQALLGGLGNDPRAWQGAFEDALERGDIPLAWALLFAFEGPSSPQLDALRLEVYHRGCGAPQAP